MMKYFLNSKLIGIVCLLITHAFSQTYASPTPFFKKHAFVFFFSSACPHCHHFSPILKNYTDKFGAYVLPLSVDNKPLPEFPHTLPATTEWITLAFKEETIRYPALFIVNPKNHALYPVSVGALDKNEFNERMIALIPKIEAYEQGRMHA